MTDSSKIKEHMKVMCSMDKQIGTVDQVEGNSIKLTKSDPPANGQHHWIPLNWVSRVDDAVHLNISGDDVKKRWSATAPVGA
ncbi:MAG: DUF2171 domain-containing protein [Gemmataceae bacterium]